VDTVEWGSAERSERSGRRLPTLRYSVPLAGALVLAALGFGALLAAEFKPWATVQYGSALTDTVRSSSLSLNTAIGLDRVNSVDVITYHFGTLALLALVGYGLAGHLAGRLAIGITAGTAAGTALTIVAVARAGHNLVANTEYAPIGAAARDGITMVTGSGVYLAFAGVALLVAAAVTANLPRRRRTATQPPVAQAVAGPPVGHVPEAAYAAPAYQDPGGFDPANRDPAGFEPVYLEEAPSEPIPGVVAGGPGNGRPTGVRDLTVSAAEPVDERYYARPEKG
jgi:hypothetical protein